MNELKRAFANFFSSQPAAPRELEQHGLDNDPPMVRNKRAETGRLVAPKSVASGTPSQDAPRAAATQPGYRENLQTPVRERAGSANAATRSFSGQVGQPSPSPPTSSPRSDAGAFFNAIKTGNLATVKKCIADGMDLNGLDSSSNQSALRLALGSKNAAMVNLLLPITSHAAKLETLASVLDVKPAHREGLKPGIKAIIDSLKKGNPGDPPLSAEARSEITIVSNLIDRWK